MLTSTLQLRVAGLVAHVIVVRMTELVSSSFRGSGCVGFNVNVCTTSNSNTGVNVNVCTTNNGNTGVNINVCTTSNGNTGVNVTSAQRATGTREST